MCEKIPVKCIAHLGCTTGAISKDRFGVPSQQSSMDALKVSLTPAQKWPKLTTKNKPGLKLPTLGNGIDGTFNLVLHKRLTTIVKHFGIYDDLTNTIASFSSHRTISLEFDGPCETPGPFLSGLLQGSLLSPVLFVIYTATLSPPRTTTPQLA